MKLKLAEDEIATHLKNGTNYIGKRICELSRGPRNKRKKRQTKKSIKKLKSKEKVSTDESEEETTRKTRLFPKLSAEEKAVQIDQDCDSHIEEEDSERKESPVESLDLKYENNLDYKDENVQHDKDSVQNQESENSRTSFDTKEMESDYGEYDHVSNYAMFETFIYNCLF